jgi:hypothetical protein
LASAFTTFADVVAQSNVIKAREDLEEAQRKLEEANRLQEAQIAAQANKAGQRVDDNPFHNPYAIQSHQDQSSSAQQFGMVDSSFGNFGQSAPVSTYTTTYGSAAAPFSQFESPAFSPGPATQYEDSSYISNTNYGQNIHSAPTSAAAPFSQFESPAFSPRPATQYEDSSYISNTNYGQNIHSAPTYSQQNQTNFMSKSNPSASQQYQNYLPTTSFATDTYTTGTTPKSPPFSSFEQTYESLQQNQSDYPSLSRNGFVPTQPQPSRTVSPIPEELVDTSYSSIFGGSNYTALHQPKRDPFLDLPDQKPQ